jgi:hypothetical protein
MGQSIKPNCHGGGPPTALGGVIADVITCSPRSIFYSFNTTCPMETEKIDCDVWQPVGDGSVAGAGQPARYNITAAISSPKLTLNVNCPNPQTINWSYDVTMSGLVFYLPGPNGSTRASSYTKM